MIRLFNVDRVLVEHYGAIKTRVNARTKKGQPALHVVKGVMGWTGGAAERALLPGRRQGK